MRRSGLIGSAIFAGMCQWQPANSGVAERQFPPFRSDLPADIRPVQGEGHTSRGPDERPATSNPGAPQINTLGELFAALRRCYQPPSLDQARPGMRITVQFAYTRDGALFGKPRILYETPGISPAHQSAYRLAVAAALARCSPLPFSKSLGNAVAGRVFAIQFVDERNLRGAHLTWPIPRTH